MQYFFYIYSIKDLVIFFQDQKLGWSRLHVTVVAYLLAFICFMKSTTMASYFRFSDRNIIMSNDIKEHAK